MNTIYICYGIPRSGKSTWAKELRDSNPNKVVRVNKDDLRAMLHSPRHSNEQEKITTAVRDSIIENALRNGKVVVVDDTNFPVGGRHFLQICDIAKKVGDVQVIEHFFDVDIKEAIRRNKESLDGKPVPEDVIHNMFNKYVKGKSYTFNSYYFPKNDNTYAKQDIGKPKIIISDLDGTLCLNKSGRSPFDWKRVGEDDVNIPVKELIQTYYDKGITIILFSGRDSICRPETEEWLYKHDINYAALFMRNENDSRKDSIVKKELYEKYILNNYYTMFWLDDRNQVVDMIRNELHLPCFQVNYGNF